MSQATDEFGVDRHGTLEHIQFGPISRVINGVPVGSIRFQAELIQGMTLYLEYTKEQYDQALGDTIFEDPVQAEQRRKELAKEGDE